MHNASSSFPRAPGRQRGFTLVELMVAIALGLLVMVALIAVYLNVSRTNSEMSRTNSMIENGRFTVDVLNEDLSHAGFWNGFVPEFDNSALRHPPGVAPADVPDAASLAMGPCAAYASWTPGYRAMLVGLPVEVFGDGLPTGCTADLIKDRKAGTDVLVVRHADACVPGTPNCEAFNASKVYFQASRCADEISPETGVPTPYDLSRRGGLAEFTLRTRACDPAARAPVVRFVSNIYYIRTWAATEGDGVPTLVRSSFGLSGGAPAFEPAQALIEGIEALRVELGLDQQTKPICTTPPNTTDYTVGLISGSAGNMVDPATCTFNAAVLTANTLPRVRGDGVPESFVRCPAGGCTVDQLRDAVAVKLYLIARSKDPSPGHVDGKTYVLGGADSFTPSGADRAFKRHQFQTTVRLTNVSGRRETPTP